VHFSADGFVRAIRDDERLHENFCVVTSLGRALAQDKLEKRRANNTT
jgi:hypothetical protein